MSRRPAGAMAALRDGIRRVNRAPTVLFGVWIVTLLFAIPFAAALREAVQADLGASQVADTVATGVNYDWMQEFSARASGLATTFKPTIIGFGAVLDNLSAFLDNERQPALIMGAAAMYIGVWIFLAGGLIDRYARERPTGIHGFFAASGVFFFRFLRLGVVMALAYGVVFRLLHPWLFSTMYPKLTRDLTVEQTAFGVRLVMYLAFGAALAACNLVFDYAKVRAVVEDRRSMVAALFAGLRFIRRNVGAVAALYLADFGLYAIVLLVYAALAPGADRGGWSMWLAFALGQAYILARLWVKLVCWATETALFQSRLAHARFVAAPVAVWPDSPAAEAISR